MAHFCRVGEINAVML